MLTKWITIRHASFSPPVESQLLSESTAGANSSLVTSCTCVKPRPGFLSVTSRDPPLSAGVLHPRPVSRLCCWQPACCAWSLSSAFLRNFPPLWPEPPPPPPPSLLLLLLTARALPVVFGARACLEVELLSGCLLDRHVGWKVQNRNPHGAGRSPPLHTGWTLPWLVCVQDQFHLAFCPHLLRKEKCNEVTICLMFDVVRSIKIVLLEGGIRWNTSSGSGLSLCLRQRSSFMSDGRMDPWIGPLHLVLVKKALKAKLV